MAGEDAKIVQRIPRERLNQIAARKLTSLGVSARLGADRETLEGELVCEPGQVLNPATRQSITRARFKVEGHDRLRFLDPPLSVLPPVVFYDADRRGVLEQLINRALESRTDALKDVVTRLEGAGLQVRLDPAQLFARADVAIPGFRFELTAEKGEVRVARVVPSAGQPFDVDASYPPLDLAEFTHLVDLEIFLEHQLGEMRKVARPVAPEGPRRPTVAETELRASAAPEGGLTLALLQQKFGSDAVLNPTLPVEVSQDWQLGGVTYKFTAVRESGTTFRARLVGPRGEKWRDSFDLAKFPGMATVVAAALGGTVEAGPAGAPRPGPATPAVPARPAAAPGRPPTLSAAPARPPTSNATVLLPPGMNAPPQAGEVWVMAVVVEQDDGQEIRYVCTDADGHPFGATRILKKADFEAVFVPSGGGWRMLIQLEQVQAGAVLYRQLGADRQPRGQARSMALGALAANFLPESAAY